MDPRERAAVLHAVLARADPARRDVLAALSDQELAVLASVLDRLVAAGPEVQAHDSGYGGTFW